MIGTLSHNRPAAVKEFSRGVALSGRWLRAAVALAARGESVGCTFRPPAGLLTACEIVGMTDVPNPVARVRRVSDGREAWVGLARLTVSRETAARLEAVARQGDAAYLLAHRVTL